jgi:hypothetical protein
MPFIAIFCLKKSIFSPNSRFWHNNFVKTQTVPRAAISLSHLSLQILAKAPFRISSDSYRPTETMFFLFALLGGRSNIIHDELLQRVTDKSFEQIVKDFSSFFIFFHAPLARVSDLAYLEYARLARENSERWNLFVCPAHLCEGLARKFRIEGYPSLFYVRNGEILDEIMGPLVYEGVQRWAIKCTTIPIVEVTNVDENLTIPGVVNITRNDEYDEDPRLFLLSDNSTKFGRVSRQFAGSGVAKSIRVVSIADPVGARIFGIRHPSLAYWRIGDPELRTYQGDPDADKMKEWLEQCPNPRFNPFSVRHLFDTSGLPKRIIIDFANRADFTVVLPKLERQSPDIEQYYADPREHPAFVQLLNIPDTASRICILSNFSKIGWRECQTYDNSSMTFVDTPENGYGFVVEVDEEGFQKMLTIGPVFLAFDKEGCLRCNAFVNLVRIAALSVEEEGGLGNIRWCVWDLAKSAPSFHNILMPSRENLGLYYFKDQNLTQPLLYRGHNVVQDIVDWAQELQSVYEASLLADVDPSEL